MKNSLNAALKELKSKGDKAFAAHHAKFFQTHKGGYGEGDLFWGLRVPQQREIAKKYYKELSLADAEKMLKHKIHEVRLTALLIMVEKYKKASVAEKGKIAKAYLRNTKYINNWDLVDLSAPYIIGEYWFENASKGLWKLARSKNLWEQRISVIATFYYIKHGKYDETLKLSEFFLNHKHDLMHKAVGWMLREAGKRDASALYSFLDKHYKKMPRTMLRYSLEKIPETKRKFYMEK